MDVPDKHPGITHIALLVRDLDEAIERVTSAGYPLSGGPMDFSPGHRGAFVRDPESQRRRAALRRGVTSLSGRR